MEAAPADRAAHASAGVHDGTDLVGRDAELRGL
jgi:hypothetical protein